MTEPTLQQELVELRREFIGLFDKRARVLCSILVDSIFVTVWLVIQWAFHGLTSTIHLPGIDQWAVSTAQVVLALSTLAAILVYIWWDLKTMYLRGQYTVEDIRHERDQRLHQAASHHDHAATPAAKSAADAVQPRGQDE